MIALLIVGGGSVYYFTRVIQAQRYMGDIVRAHPASLTDALDLFAGAPAMICLETRGIGDDELFIRAYFRAGLTRIDILPPEADRSGVATHAVMSAEDLYAWYDDSTVVHYREASSGETSDIPGFRSASQPLFQFSSCGVWWRPDDSIFEIPHDLLVTEGSLPQ